MESNFPKKTNVYRIGDKVICVNHERSDMYMQMGIVKYVGKYKNIEKSIGVEFEKKLREKVNTK